MICINSSNTITLNNNDFVYIDRGAIVEGKFLCNNKSNVRIVGEGVVSGATFTRSVNQGKALIPYDFNYCNNIAIEGIVTLDPAGWCYNMYFCNDLTIDNVKIITSRANGDGISIQSCNNVKVTNSFVRSWDDSLVVKNYPMWSNRDNEGSSSNILFDNCVIWTDLAQSMEIGYETIGEIMKDITFSNITILHNYHKACISIHNGNNANIENVHYKNIIIEDASMGKGDGRNVLIEITTEFSSTWSTNHKTTSLGSINDVLIEDVYCYNANNPLISLRGSIDGRSGYSKDIHYVSNITFKNVYINDELLSNNYDNFESIYCENIIFQE